jgi:hypothetical protein
MMKVTVKDLSQLTFPVAHMVVWRDSLIVLSNTGKLYMVVLEE